MLQDIEPHVYHNAMSFDPPAPDDIGLLCQAEGILARQENGALRLPPVRACDSPAGWVYGFQIDGVRYYLPLGPVEAPGFLPVAARRYRSLGPRQTVFACAVGESLSRWYAGNRFCGGCGRPMLPSSRERALVCAACGRTVYPKICPAVIVAVCDGDRLLLTKYAGGEFRRYALVAGFNEIGEAIEQTVAREVLEETGLQVQNLRFYKSQPWVVTDSLLLGFFADLAGSDQVTLQLDELSEAVWVPRDQIPANHSMDSLTGEMMERFRAGKER